MKQLSLICLVAILSMSCESSSANSTAATDATEQVSNEESVEDEAPETTGDEPAEPTEKGESFAQDGPMVEFLKKPTETVIDPKRGLYLVDVFVNSGEDGPDVFEETELLCGDEALKRYEVTRSTLVKPLDHYPELHDSIQDGECDRKACVSYPPYDSTTGTHIVFTEDQKVAAIFSYSGGLEDRAVELYESYKKVKKCTP